MGVRQNDDAFFKCFYASALVYAVLVNALGTVLNEHPLVRTAALILFMLSLMALIFYALPSRALKAAGSCFALALLLATPAYVFLPISGDFVLVAAVALFVIVIFLGFAPI